MFVQASQAMAKSFVKVSAMATVKETLGLMLAVRQRCALVVDENDLLEGIMTITDLERVVLRAAEDHGSSGGPSILEVLSITITLPCELPKTDVSCKWKSWFMSSESG